MRSEIEERRKTGAPQEKPRKSIIKTTHLTPKQYWAWGTDWYMRGEGGGGRLLNLRLLFKIESRFFSFLFISLDVWWRDLYPLNRLRTPKVPGPSSWISAVKEQGPPKIVAHKLGDRTPWTPSQYPPLKFKVKWPQSSEAWFWIT